jgi:hypothetical protein
MNLHEADSKRQNEQFAAFCVAIGSFCEMEFPKYDKLVSRMSAVDVALARLVVDQEESLRSVRLLHSQRFTIQTNMVVRHMYENAVNAIALTFPIDSQFSRRTLAIRFIKYGAIVKWQHIEALRSRKPDIATAAELRLERQQEREAMRYFKVKPNKAGVRLPPRTWHPWGGFAGIHDQVRHAIVAGKVSSSVYGDIDLFDWHYHALYRYTNASVHSDWASLTARVDLKVNPPVLGVASGSEGGSVFASSVKLFIDTLSCFAIHKGIMRRVEADLLKYC